MDLASDVARMLSRRGVLKAAAAGSGLVIATQLGGCASESEDVAAGADAVSVGGVEIKGNSFYEDIATAQQALAGKPADLGKAIGAIIGFWLARKPYSTTDASGKRVRGLFDELFDNRKTNPVFQPGIGPVIVFQHQDVLDVLTAANGFTVDPYAPMMRATTSGAVFPPAAGSAPDGKTTFYDHFMLGTDNDRLYVTDSLINRSVVRPDDVARLRTLIRSSCDALLAGVTRGKVFDAVDGLCRYVPVAVVQDYLGLPSYAPGQGGAGAFNINGLKAGDALDASTDPDLKEFAKRSTFTRTGGKSQVPTRAEMYQWIKSAFQNVFNNVGRDPAVDAAGIESSERILIWQAKVLAVYKKRLVANGFRVGEGTDVPDTMMSRLLVLQNDARGTRKAELIQKLGCASEAELFARTSDDRVQANSFGTIVGAIANPEEANARLVQSLVRFREGALKGRGPSSYGNLKELAVGAISGETNMRAISRYVLELLRVNPQGETLLRRCEADTTINGVAIKKGQLVFACHGAAMRDPAKIPEPEKIDVSRDDQSKVYKPGSDQRAREKPQSSIYLQHGFGRHKCLGRYASEITMEEVVRGLLRKGDPTRTSGSDLKMDERNLYAVSFPIVLQ
jgi:cytochrome P450